MNRVVVDAGINAIARERGPRCNRSFLSFCGLRLSLRRVVRAACEDANLFNKFLVSVDRHACCFLDSDKRTP